MVHHHAQVSIIIDPVHHPGQVPEVIVEESRLRVRRSCLPVHDLYIVTKFNCHSVSLLGSRVDGWLGAWMDGESCCSIHPPNHPYSHPASSTPVSRPSPPGRLLH